MKKLFLFFLIGIFAFDFAEAQMVFNGGPSQASAMPGYSQLDDYSSLLAKKRRKKKRKSSRKKGRGSSSPTAAVGVGLAYNLPMGAFAKEDTIAPAIKGGLGVNIDADYFVAPSFSVGVNTGYHGFKYDLADDSLIKFTKKKYAVIPLNIKATYYFGEDAFKPYIGLNLGMFIINSKVAYSVKTDYYNPVTDSTEVLWMRSEKIDMMTKFGIAPMAGFLYDVSDQMALNFNVRYDNIMAKDEKNGFHNASFLGLNFGILFKL